MQLQFIRSGYRVGLRRAVVSPANMISPKWIRDRGSLAQSGFAFRVCSVFIFSAACAMAIFAVAQTPQFDEDQELLAQARLFPDAGPDARAPSGAARRGFTTCCRDREQWSKYIPR